MRKSFSFRQVLADWQRTVRTTPALMLGIVMATLGLTASIVKADILYDTLWMTDTGDFTPSNSTQSFIGGAANNFGQVWDMQTADDFNLSSSYTITNVTADFIVQQFDPIMPAGGVLVEFFQDVGGAPSETAYAQVLATGGSVTGSSFVNPHDSGIWSDAGMRMSVDLSGEDISLDAGTWWISIVPVDETAGGLAYRNVSRVGELGFASHIRNGGDAHGNGYGGTFPPEWDSFAETRDLAFQITGIPGPGALPILGLAGLVSFGRRRRQ